MLPIESRVHHGDALELLKRLPARSVRLTLADPPYNTRREDNLETMGRTSMDYPWDGPMDHLAWLELQDRALMPGGSLVCFYDWKHMNELTNMCELELGYDVKRLVIWRKLNPNPGNRARVPAQAVELGFWAVKPGAPWVFNCPGDLTYADFLWFDTGVARAGRGQPRHEAMKAGDLYRGLIEILTEPGDVVLDPFCGSGTTAREAVGAGRIAICFEKDKAWAKSAQAALEATSST